MNQKFIISAIGADNTAYLSYSIASLLWVIGFLYVNESDVDTYSSNLSRGVALILLNIIPLYWSSKYYSKPQIPPVSYSYVTIRNLIMTVHGYAFSEALFYLPSPILYTLYFSGPLFIISIDYLAFKNTITKKQAQGAGLAFIGVLLTSNGLIITSWITGAEFESSFQNYKTESNLVKALVMIGMIILTCFWAWGVLIVRKIKKISTWEINFNFGYILTIFSGLFYQFGEEGKDFEFNILLFLKCLLFQGLPLALGQIFFMYALTLTQKVGIVTMIGFIGLVFSYFLSILRYGEQINVIQVTGTSLVMLGVFRIVMK